MMIQKTTGTITSVADLSGTAREVTLALPAPLEFLSGAFVNVFIPQQEGKKRRAYSISSSPENQREVSLSIRRTLPLSPSALFWQDSVVGTTLELMGPLGVNTVDKITKPRVFLIGFGIGVSVVKGMLHGLLTRTDIEEIWVITGSRSEEEILYKDFFESVAHQDARVRTRFVVSRDTTGAYPYRGHVQQHLTDLSFEGASVYLCGSTRACEETKKVITDTGVHDTQFFIESFDG